MIIRIAATSLLLFASLSTAHAQAITECVDLDASWKVARGSNAVLLRHDKAHYRLDLQPGCKGLKSSNKLEISAEQRSNRLCPSGSEVTTATGNCAVSAIEPINYNEFERARRER